MTRLGGRELGAIFLGGAIGAVVRVWLGLHYAGGGASGWPWVTFSINVTGSFALGWLATRLQAGPQPPDLRHRLLGTGFCGAYTTFSTMQVEILAMIDHGHDGLAMAYALASLTVGYLAIWTATALVRRTWAVA